MLDAFNLVLLLQMKYIVQKSNYNIDLLFKMKSFVLIIYEIFTLKKKKKFSFITHVYGRASHRSAIHINFETHTHQNKISNTFCFI